MLGSSDLDGPLDFRRRPKLLAEPGPPRETLGEVPEHKPPLGVWPLLEAMDGPRQPEAVPRPIRPTLRPGLDVGQVGADVLREELVAAAGAGPNRVSEQAQPLERRGVAALGQYAAGLDAFAPGVPRASLPSRHGLATLEGGVGRHVLWVIRHARPAGSRPAAIATAQKSTYFSSWAWSKRLI